MSDYFSKIDDSEFISPCQVIFFQLFVIKWYCHLNPIQGKCSP